MATGSHLASESDLRCRIVEETIPLLAIAGIRGATMRDVAARCGASVASIASLFGNKDGLIGACFAEVVRRDIARIDRLIDEYAEMQAAPELAPAFLWMLCGDAGTSSQTERMILVELLLSAATLPQFAGLCRQWLLARRDALRRMAATTGGDPIAFDIMGLHLLSESSFAVSCGGSATYALLARAGFLEAAALLAGRPAADEAGLAGLARHFFADPTVDRKGAVAVKERGADRRGRIIDAAASIIEEEGLAAVTNRSVADRAGVSLALTTYHFKSVSDLAFSGILRVFEKVNAGLLDRGRHDAGGAERALERIRSRSQPSGVERLRSRGMAEISLAAARGLADDGLGLAMRQQRGTITHASLGAAMQATVTRTRAASHALWSSAAFLVAAAIDDADSLYDFEAQARFAAERLLQNS